MHDSMNFSTFYNVATSRALSSRMCNKFSSKGSSLYHLTDYRSDIPMCYTLWKSLQNKNLETFFCTQPNNISNSLHLMDLMCRNISSYHKFDIVSSINRTGNRIVFSNNSSILVINGGLSNVLRGLVPDSIVVDNFCLMSNGVQASILSMINSRKDTDAVLFGSSTNDGDLFGQMFSEVYCEPTEEGVYKKLSMDSHLLRFKAYHLEENQYAGE